MDGDLCTKVLEGELMLSIGYLHKNPSHVAPSTPAKRPRTGSKTIIFKSCHVQHSPQTSIPLSTSGSTSRGGLEGTPHHLGDIETVGMGGEGVGGHSLVILQGFGGEYAQESCSID